MRHALVVGATGLVGSALVQVLVGLRQKPRITVLTRRPVGGWPASVEEFVGNVVDETFVDQYITPQTWIFCCVGTTMAKAGSAEGFLKVDLEIPLALGRAAKLKQAQGFTVVSSIGANARGFFFYTRTKGAMEEGLQLLNMPSLHIFRPGLLVGKRPGPRLGERIGQIFTLLLAPFLIGPFAGYGSIRAVVVAKAMVTAALRGTRGTQFYYNWQMRPLARKLGNNS